MIVTCTKCQAKFRVADEKIGPRGAKVRCSKCQTVFLVRPEGAAPSAPAPSHASGVELEPPRPAAAPAAPQRWDPSQPDLSAPPALGGPPPLPPPLPGARAADPFAAIATFPPPAPPPPDPFAAQAPPFDPTSPPGFPPPDPFAARPAPDPFAPAPARAPDPFAAAAAPDPFSAAAPDPFATAASDPFPGAASDPFAQGSSAPPNATDLGDLLGAAASAAPAADPSAEAAAAPGAEAQPEDADGLVLEERAPAPPKPASSAPFDLGAEAGYDAFAAGDDPGFDPGALELGSPATSVPPLATATVAPPALAPAAEAPPVAPRAAARPAGALPAEEAPDFAPEPAPGRGRLRSVALNAVALAALLVAAVVILALWRTEGPIDAAALRPSAIAAALRGRRADAPFTARDVSSGLYERERAPPVLFVRGTVVSRAAGPVARVQVRVEIVRGGAVVASGEALAGALPTPEELWSARDAAALAQVTADAAARAPAAIRPGDAVPFLVAIADQPADLAGASLRVQAAPAGSPPP